MKITNLIYQLIIFLWQFVPLKKYILLIIRDWNIPFSKLRDDLWFNGTYSHKYENYKICFSQTRLDKVSYFVFWDRLEGGWDAISLKVWLLLVKDANTVLDIGANIGIYSIIAKKANKNLKVYAFEPANRTLEVLIKNLELNKVEVQILPIALSDSNGEATFYDNYFHTAAASLKAGTASDNQITYNVGVKRYDSLDIPERIQALVIDIERNELEALIGMESMIERDRPDIIIEVLDDEMGEKLEQFFSKYNYLYFHIDESKGLRSVSKFEIPINAPINSRNYLVCTAQTNLLIKHLLV
jgi:FkbM family methyltransferase